MELFSSFVSLKVTISIPYKMGAFLYKNLSALKGGVILKPILRLNN